MPVHYENHVKTRECPKCGIQRPLDWFANEGEPCWKCKNLAWKDKRTPEDGLLGSISKRHGKHAKGACDDLIGYKDSKHDEVAARVAAMHAEAEGREDA